MYVSQRFPLHLQYVATLHLKFESPKMMLISRAKLTCSWGHRKLDL